jgi:MraZ protein
MTTFVGTFSYKVDEKGRVPIPPSFRSDLADGGYLTQGDGNCIAVLTKSKFDEIARGLQPDGLPKGPNRIFSRSFFSKATELKLDGQSRVMLPLELRQKAGITDSAVVIGVNSYAEIWNPEKWKIWDEAQEKPWDIIDTIEVPQDKPE